jgi:hypothetical protein
VSIAPTQLSNSPPPQLLAASQHGPPRPQTRHQHRLSGWGLEKEARYWQELDAEALLETEEMSRQTTPGASRAASPGPATAPQPTQADLAAAISQQLGQGTPCSEEIMRHYPRVQASSSGGAQHAAFTLSKAIQHSCAWEGGLSLCVFHAQ